ncbi:MAG: hypothetical protein HYT80_05395 [Euryarchaeota archaeon]|nr:hypothetical protein [Euryarchaeota archaeon]
MRLLGVAVLAAAFALSGCIEEFVLEETAVEDDAEAPAARDDRAWERENVGKPAQLSGFHFSMLVSRGGATGLKAEATLGGPATDCVIESVSAVRCSWHYKWSVVGGSSALPADVRIWVADPTQPQSLCSIGFSGECARAGTEKGSIVADAENAYVDWTAYVKVETAGYAGPAVVAKSYDMRKSDVSFQVDFDRDGRPVPAVDE